MTNELVKIAEKEIENLKRSIVATPETREKLDAFAKSNNGSSDFLLSQMAVQFGYVLALEMIIQSAETPATKE
jgi:hypothetical protein